MAIGENYRYVLHKPNPLKMFGNGNWGKITDKSRPFLCLFNKAISNEMTAK